MISSHPAHSINPAWFALGPILGGAVAGWLAQKVQRRFAAPIVEPARYPIVLKPQNWAILLMRGMALAVLAMSLICVTAGISGHLGMRDSLIISAITAVLSTAGFFKAYACSKERITIYAEKLVHTKWGKAIEINRDDIESFKLHNDWVHVKRKSQRKVVIISLCFENIQFLRATLHSWCPTLVSP